MILIRNIEDLLEDWQKEAAMAYFKMGTGCWPEELHALARQITKEVGMCGEVMLAVCQQYVYMRCEEYKTYWDKKGMIVTKVPSISIIPDGHTPPLEMLELEEMWKIKPEVRDRWEGWSFKDSGGMQDEQ